MISISAGLTENDRHENDGPSKLHDTKSQDTKLAQKRQTFETVHTLSIDLALLLCSHESIYKYLDTGLPSLSIGKMRAPQTHLSRTCPACITLTHARQPNLSSALLVLPAGLVRMRHRENRGDREFMLGNSGTKLPARCMLGMRGDFEGLANWVSMLPLCL